jgi:hypothetical protein
MIHHVWRLSETGENNLGLAVTERGLLLGRTPLIDRRDGRFFVREQNEIENLLRRAYPAEFAIEAADARAGQCRGCFKCK